MPKDNLKDQAYSLGFRQIAVARPSAIPGAPARLGAFVANNWHGQMTWMAERMNWRGNPAALWPEARSVIMLAMPYTPDHDPLEILGQPDKGAISVYAQGRDYHDVVKKKLKALGRWLIAEAGGEIKVFVDTAPVMEKPLAQAAGLGWQGKHTNLVSRELGNWFFLGAIFTTLDLEPDEPEPDNCGSCRACIDICPTRAIVAPYQLDARRCISYLTIEHKGPVDKDLRPALGNRIYGCDDCLAICPWNKFAVPCDEPKLKGREDLKAPDLSTLADLDDTGFRALFSGSPIKRIGRDRFVRNVIYAIGNSGDPAFLPVLASLRKDPDATVSEAAEWATERLQDPQ